MIDVKIEYFERGIIIDDNIFVSGDYHLGYSDSIDTMTIEDEKQEIFKHIDSVLENKNIDLFIINGDIFHRFTPASKNTRRLYHEIISHLEENNVDIKFIKGNHDRSTNSKYPSLVDFNKFISLELNDQEIIIIHGHNKYNISGDLIILNHLHPIVKIDSIKWPAYLYGENIYENADVLILPAFTSYQDGVTISDTVDIDIDFPIVTKRQFEDFKPIVFDESKNVGREFPKFSKISNKFNL